MENTLWLWSRLLQPFTAVRDLYLSQAFVFHVVWAMQDPNGQGRTIARATYYFRFHAHQGKAPAVIHASDSIIRLASVDYQKIIFLRIFLPPLIFIALIVTLSYIICHNFSIISLVFMQYLLQNKMIFQN